MRDTWAAYLVDIASGTIEWTLGGRHSSFKFGPGAAFQWQHDVAARPDSTVTLFDDHCCQLTGGGTYVAADRALARRSSSSSTRSGTRPRSPASTATSYGFESEYMGDTQPLPSGNVFVGWGSAPYFSEYTRSGKLLSKPILPGPDLSYRATLEPWVGLPLTRPAGAARRSGVGGRPSTRAGTAPRSSPPGACSASVGRGQPRARGERPARRLRDGDPGRRQLLALRGAGARRARARARHLARRSQPAPSASAIA